MRKFLMAAALLAGVATTGGALADDDDCNVPMANWQSREAVQKMAEAQGWTVRRIKTDDGCYEIKGTDAEGRMIEVKVDPGTLALVRTEFEFRPGADPSRYVTVARAMAPPCGTIAPPDNRLFNNGARPSSVIE